MTCPGLVQAMDMEARRSAKHRFCLCGRGHPATDPAGPESRDAERGAYCSEIHSLQLGNDTSASPRNVREGPWVVGPAGLVGIAYGGIGARPASVERCRILA